MMTWWGRNSRIFAFHIPGEMLSSQKKIQVCWNPANDVESPRHPVIFSADDWGVQSLSQNSIEVPLPFSEGDWIRGVGEVTLFQIQSASWSIRWKENCSLCSSGESVQFYLPTAKSRRLIQIISTTSFVRSPMFLPQVFKTITKKAFAVHPKSTKSF